MPRHCPEAANATLSFAFNFKVWTFSEIVRLYPLIMPQIPRRNLYGPVRQILRICNEIFKLCLKVKFALRQVKFSVLPKVKFALRRVLEEKRSAFFFLNHILTGSSFFCLSLCLSAFLPERLVYRKAFCLGRVLSPP